jgi:hypothetical protein
VRTLASDGLAEVPADAVAVAAAVFPWTDADWGVAMEQPTMTMAMSAIAARPVAGALCRDISATQHQWVPPGS